jgi:hypothetical protein
MTSVAFVLRVLYASAFIFATIENWAAFIQIFPTPYWRLAGMPSFSAVYFYSLLLIDPIVSALLLLRPKIGIVLAGLIVATNVAHNTWLIRHMNASPDSMYWLTIAFLAFYSLTLPVWRGLHRESLSSEMNSFRFEVRQ